jgi:hypothetical protein
LAHDEAKFALFRGRKAAIQINIRLASISPGDKVLTRGIGDFLLSVFPVRDSLERANALPRHGHAFWPGIRTQLFDNCSRQGDALQHALCMAVLPTLTWHSNRLVCNAGRQPAQRCHGSRDLVLKID